MNQEQILIVLIVSIISTSGMVINLIKKGKKGKVKSISDSNTLFWFRVLVPFALAISVLFYFLNLGNIILPKTLVLFGYFLVVAGLIIRWFAVASLGEAFTVKISIIENHALKKDGIYKFIRHPSYTGFLFYYIGLGIVMQNWLCLLILIAFPLFVVINRIQKEEKVLLMNFPIEYVDYKKMSWCLFPFIY